MEQGKDVITVDDSGQFHAYQLKTGAIKLASWRSIKGEIDELIELPILHPSVPEGASYTSYLVCNGDVTDEVRIQINQRNEDNRRKGREYSYLNIITLHKLLEYFVDAQRGFLPNTLEEFDAFLRLHLSDGRDFLDKAALSRFLTGSVLIPDATTNSDRIHAVSSSVVLLGHLLKPYQEAQNHFALFEAWGLLAAAIVNYAELNSLRAGWQESLDLALNEAIESLLQLKEETLSRTDFLEGDQMGDGGHMYRGRLTTVLGAIAFLELHLLCEGMSKKPDERVVDLICSNLNRLWLWGDSAVPFLLNIVWVLEKADRTNEAEELLSYLLTLPLSSTASVGKYIEEVSPLPAPYYSLGDVLETIYGVADDAIDFGEFTGSSYSLEVVVHAIARRGLRRLLDPNWRRATQVAIHTFVPDRPEGYFSWHVANGSNRSYFLRPTESWRRLVEESRERTNSVLLRNQKILRMFTLIAPHRLTRRTSVIGDPYVA